MTEAKVTACCHEQPIFTIEKRDMLVSIAMETLKTWTNHFDAIAISGYSSAMTAPILAHLLRKNIVLVRKASEVRFSCFEAEGKHGQRVLFLDDLISSGNTLRHVYNGLAKLDCKIVGYYLYMNTNHWGKVDEVSPDIINMNLPYNQYFVDIQDCAGR